MALGTFLQFAIPIGICVSLDGEHNSLGIYVSQVGEHI